MWSLRLNMCCKVILMALCIFVGSSDISAKGQAGGYLRKFVGSMSASPVTSKLLQVAPHTTANHIDGVISRQPVAPEQHALGPENGARHRVPLVSLAGGLEPEKSRAVPAVDQRVLREVVVIVPDFAVADGGPECGERQYQQRSAPEPLVTARRGSRRIAF